MGVKLLANLLVGLIILRFVYWMMYFKVMPKILFQYRKFVNRSKDYKEELKDIEKDQ